MKRQLKCWGAREGKEGKSQASCYYKPNLNPFYITRGSVVGSNTKSRKFGWYGVFIMLKMQLFHVKDEAHWKNTVGKPHSHYLWNCRRKTSIDSTANGSPSARAGSGLSPFKNSIQKNLCCRPCLASPIFYSAYQCHSTVTSHITPSQQEHTHKKNCL